MDDLKIVIRNNMYEAMKNHNIIEKKIWSLALQAIEKLEKDSQKELSYDDIIKVLSKEVKQYHETLNYAIKANSEDIIRECNLGIKLLNEYLPKMKTKEEVICLIQDISNTIEPIKKNQGKFMKELSQYKTTVDMKMASEILKELLQ